MVNFMVCELYLNKRKCNQRLSSFYKRSNERSGKEGYRHELMAITLKLGLEMHPEGLGGFG